jgi:hypothetical protein
MEQMGLLVQMELAGLMEPTVLQGLVGHQVQTVRQV